MDGVAQDVAKDGAEADDRQSAELARLVMCREKLSVEDGKLFRDEGFREILTAHQDLVWEQLRRRGLQTEEMKDISQEVFLRFYGKVLASGFPDNIPGMLSAITHGKFLNYLHAKKKHPASVALPSSDSMPPRSSFDLDRALDHHRLKQEVLSRLTLEQLAVLEAVVINRLSHRDAADLLKTSEGKLKVLLAGAKKSFGKLIRRHLPAKTKGTW
jgi:DNA-directed RNA polymerase specialized sigma24 family protein